MKKNKEDSFIIKIEKKSAKDSSNVYNYIMNIDSQKSVFDLIPVSTFDDIFNECSQMTYSQLPLSLWLKLYSKLYRLTLPHLLEIKSYYNNKLHAHEQEILSNMSLNENKKRAKLIQLNETNLIITRLIIQILSSKDKTSKQKEKKHDKK